MEQTQYRRFNPDLDSRPVLHAQFLRRDEDAQFVFGTTRAEAAYDVRDRRRDGSAKRFSLLYPLKRFFLGLFRLVFKVIDMIVNWQDYPEGGRGVVPVTVSGPKPDCRAAALADSAKDRTGIWVLTDQRFAFIDVRHHDQRDAVSGTTGEALDMLKLSLGNLPGDWTGGEDDSELAPVNAVPVFELKTGEYQDHGRDERKPKGSKEGLFHLLEFPDGSSIALGIDAPF